MQKHREHWGSRIGFILAALGSAIGLGVLWKFPYVTGQNGGGLFVLIYIVCTFFVGVPIFIAELILGRKAQRGAVGTFAMLSNDSAIWKTAGWLGVASSFLIMSFYSIVAGWCLNYVFMSLNQFYLNRSATEISQVFDLLASSGDITLFWHFMFTAITAGVVYRGVRQGIEYWSKFMTSTLFIILLGMCLYSLTLDGFGKGFTFTFSPDITKFKASSALEALGLSFFTLSLGQGIMITYGSYMRRQDDIPHTAGIVGIMIVIVSIMAALVIFPIIFTFGFAPEAGEGLIFKTLPVVFAKLPGSLFISTIFFILLVFTALTSAVALIEVVSANFIDLNGWSRQKAVIITSVSCFVFGIPSALSSSHSLFANWSAIYGKTFFNTINDLVSVWLLPISGLMIAIYVGWVLDKQLLQDEFMSGTRFGKMWKPWMFFMRWVAPIAIVFIMLQTSGLVDADKVISRVFG